MEFVYEPPRLPDGAVIETPDRPVRVISRRERPCVAVLAEVLRPDECAALIDLARPALREATVLDDATGLPRPDRNRRCTMHHLRRDETPWLAVIERRLAHIMGMPVEHGEGLQVLRYLPGGEYKPHQDFFAPEHYDPEAAHLRVSGQRVASLIIYLNDVASGGDTYFPLLDMRVAPRQGGAVYFEYCNRWGQLDGQTLHGGAPVAEGEKWIATKWMRQRPWPQRPR